MAMVMPAPGMQPKRLPMTEARSQVGSSCLHLAREGNATLSLVPALTSCSASSTIWAFQSPLSWPTFSAIFSTERMPNRPIIRGTRGMPSIRLREPKVKRVMPVEVLMPMQLSHRPKPMDKKCFQQSLPAIPITVAMPSIPSMKYSGGPNFRAKEASSGAKNISTRALEIPPNVELVIQTLNASRPCPFCRSW